MPEPRGGDITQSWVQCALRISPTAGGLPPLRGFVAPFGRYGRGRSYLQLHSRCSLAGGYDCVVLRANVTTASSPLMACDSVSPSGTVATMRNYNV